MSSSRSVFSMANMGPGGGLGGGAGLGPQNMMGPQGALISQGGMGPHGAMMQQGAMGPQGGMLPQGAIGPQSSLGPQLGQIGPTGMPTQQGPPMGPQHGPLGPQGGPMGPGGLGGPVGPMSASGPMVSGPIGAHPPAAVLGQAAGPPSQGPPPAGGPSGQAPGPPSTQELQQRFDNVAKVRVLVSSLKDILSEVVRVAAMNIYHTAAVDNGVRASADGPAPRLDKALEDFNSICNQIEYNLKTIQECMLQCRDSQQYLPFQMQLTKAEGSNHGDNTLSYGQYIATIGAQIAFAKQIQEILTESASRMQHQQQQQQQVPPMFH